MVVNFKTLFPVSKPIIGMIHLAGRDSNEKARRALEELAIYQEEGVDGAIIEDYHGHTLDVRRVLFESSQERSRGLDIVRGVNVLKNPFAAFEYAKNSGAKFIQLDSIQGHGFNSNLYALHRRAFPDIAVLGGVRFKYQDPTGRTLEEDIAEGRSRCDAVVTTGDGTGIETPIVKLQEFRKNLDTFPLLVGAGVTAENVTDQFLVADGAIVGSYFKPDKDTELPVDRKRVREFMDVVRYIRKNYS